MHKIRSSEFAALLLVQLLAPASFTVFNIALPLYLDSLGISIADIGILFTLASVFYVVVRLFVAEYSDLVGRKLFYVSSILISAVSTGALAFSARLSQILAVKAVRDTASAAFWTTSYAMAGDKVSKAYRGRFMGLFDSASTIGGGIGLVIGGWLAYEYGFFDTFLIASAALLAAFALSSLLITESRESRVKGKLSHSRAIRKSMRFARAPYNIKALALSGFFLLFGFQLTESFILPILLSTEFGLDAFQVGAIFSAGWFSAALVYLRSRHLADSVFSLKHLYVSGLIVCALFTMLMAFAPNPFYMALFWTAHGAAFGVIGPASSKMVLNFAREKNRARDMNFTRLGGDIGIILSGVTAGSLAQLFGMRPIFLLEGVLIIIAALAVLALVREHAPTS